MDPVAEPHMASRIQSIDVEHVRIGEDLWIAVRRHHPQQHRLAGTQHAPSAFMIFGHHPHH